MRIVGHDPAAYTQGLICVDTVIYESTGLVGQSSLRRVGASGGRILQNIPVPGVFAEGIAIFKGELVQLTWQDGLAIRYEYPSLKAKPSTYMYKGEGWGLTNNDTHFIMSDGSDTLYLRNDKFETARKIPVTLDGKPLKRLNELEYARGYVYANVWYKDFIAEISPADGRVTRIIDCSELIKIEMPSMRDHVLNGIAYCDSMDEWILTGKNWRNMFIVKIPKP
uniref:Glutamine cyclotransferase n=1 Tax=uncultured bacterium contig00093 TaxID=1181564 RepID=A0A806KQP4_9BACT|nr:glutamine cyclotransferase [uncultured bacterium contig00093]